MGIGPSTKETSLHHFRDPILEVVSQDTDIDFLGIIVFGTPQDNKGKHMVGERTALWLEAMSCDGAIISTDAWGNSDVDYMNALEEIGKKGISMAGLKFQGKIANFVVINEYVPLVLDINKSESGKETEVVGENNVDAKDARKALVFLKHRMKQEGKM